MPFIIIGIIIVVIFFIILEKKSVNNHNKNINYKTKDERNDNSDNRE